MYALQARWAVTDRLAIIAVKDGYLNIDTPKYTSGGWADLAAGLKYAVIDDKAHEFILTPGVTVGLPTGNDRVFQATGDGTINPFVPVGKGFGKPRLLGNVGGIIYRWQRRDLSDPVQRPDRLHHLPLFRAVRRLERLHRPGLPGRGVRDGF